MFLSSALFESILILILVLFVLLILYVVISSAILKNKKMKILDLHYVDFQLANKYSTEFLSFNKEEFPVIVENFNIIKAESNIIFRSKKEFGKKILFVLKDETRNVNLYSLFVAISSLIKKEEFIVDLTILYLDNENQEILNSLEKNYQLVLFDNFGILNPKDSLLRSHNAFVGVKTNAYASFKFETERISDGFKKMEEFKSCLIKEFNKLYLSKPIIDIVKSIGKDMPYSDRLIFTNPKLFKPFTKSILKDSRFSFIKGLQTEFIFEEITFDDENCYLEVNVKIALGKSLKDVLKKLTPNLNRFGISYILTSYQEETNYLNNKDYDYKIFEKNITNVYKINCIPAIVEKTLPLHFNNILSFNPLYNYNKVKEKEKYLVLAIQFYTKLLDEYGRRKKCIAQLVEKC